MTNAKTLAAFAALVASCPPPPVQAQGGPVTTVQRGTGFGCPAPNAWQMTNGVATCAAPPPPAAPAPAPAPAYPATSCAATGVEYTAQFCPGQACDVTDEGSFSWGVPKTLKSLSPKWSFMLWCAATPNNRLDSTVSCTQTTISASQGTYSITCVQR